ncbi:2-hydroxyacyl-CoA dehydratase [Pelomyxa schiedti]|nr:2-hydroxyacyl-CoA dehydratase [Pelomyxa schiedti]
MSFGCSISPETDDEIKALFRYFNHPHCAIKIDQNANMASLRVRVRSLLATWEEQRAQKMGASLTASSLASRTSTSNTTISTCTSTGITTKASVSSLRPIPYRADSCCKAPTTILFMNFSPEHTKLYATAFNTGGYHSIPCPDIPEVARNELAMRYIHPDVCYGVSIVVGSWLYALLNGLVDPNNTDVMWIHMGGSCTSRRMAWFARDAFDRAGFPQVGVFSIDCSATVNPAYTLGQTLRINMGLAWGDALSMVLYRTRPYELIPNSANTLHQTWMERALASVSTGSPVLFSSLVHEMVKDFEALPLWTETHDKPRVGLVGLMCKADPVKYNWLLRFLEEEQQCEVAPFFFTEYSEVAGYNNVANHNYFASDTGKWLGGAACRKVICLFRNPVLSALGKSKRFIHPLPLENLENLAKRFVSPLHQAGEGWLIVAQILQHLQNGVSNIVVTAPSGCLPIHIGGRGMMKAIQEQYPQANIVVLDYDSSASFIHQLNRIKLMLWCAKDKPSLIFSGWPTPASSRGTTQHNLFLWNSGMHSLFRLIPLQADDGTMTVIVTSSY